MCVCVNGHKSVGITTFYKGRINRTYYLLCIMGKTIRGKVNNNFDRLVPGKW